jgi:hypothetical protein
MWSCFLRSDALHWIDARALVAKTSDMTAPATQLLNGGCACGAVRYSVQPPAWIVHCCHCRWCQRESGTAFALNAMLEMERIVCSAGQPVAVDTPSQSGAGQRILRCPTCRVALWSHYAAAGPLVAFLRVGTLDDPSQMPPDIHIFTESKQPWVMLPAGARAVPEQYRRDECWPASSLARLGALLPRMKAWHAMRRERGMQAWSEFSD